MNQHRANPEQILLLQERARYREKYRCAACMKRVKLMGGTGECKKKMQFQAGGTCGFELDERGV